MFEVVAMDSQESERSDSNKNNLEVEKVIDDQTNILQNPNDDAIEWKEDDGEDEEARIELGLVGKIWTKRSINATAFMNTIKKAWQLTHGLDISSIGENTYVFQFHHWRDKLRVIEEKPWHFDRHAILLSDITGDIKPSEMELFELPMWVRVYNLPFKGRMQRENVEAMGKKVGRFIKADMSGSVGIDKSIRLRIGVDVRKPLIQKIKVKMRGGDEEFFEVKYEKPPIFCFFCGLMGHGVKDCLECRDEEDPYEKYGGWLKASPWKRVSDGWTRGRSEMPSTCARSLFITRARKTPSVKVCAKVTEVEGKLRVCGLEKADPSGSEPQSREGGIKACEKAGPSSGFLQNENGRDESKEDDNNQSELNGEGKKTKGWKRRARKKSEGTIEGIQVSGERRKWREGESMQEELHEGETCGIKKKIVLDVSVLRSNNDEISTVEVASPTHRALGGQ